MHGHIVPGVVAGRATAPLVPRADSRLALRAGASVVAIETVEMDGVRASVREVDVLPLSAEGESVEG